METLITASSLLIGKEVASQTINRTSNSIITSLGVITENYGTDCERLFADLDIKFKMEIITGYISKINLSSLRITCEAVTKCIEYIKESLLQIEKEMDELQQLKADYNKQWFGNAFSSTKFTESFNKIKLKVYILDQRFDMLMKLLD
jgi:hypothetical protein